MKNELLEILKIEFNDSRVKEDLIKLSENLINYYEINRTQSENKFKQTLDKYNFETIAIFSESPEYPSVTLFHGSGGLEFWPVIDYQGGVSNTDESIGSIIKEPPFEKSEYWLNDNDYEDHLKEEIIVSSWEIHRRIVFVWLSTIWQDIKGYDYGILVKTLENNSVKQFIFNDLSWDNLSYYSNYNNKEERLKKHFQTNLTVKELNERVKKKR